MNPVIYDIGGEAVVGVLDLGGYAHLEVFYLSGTGTLILGPVYAPPPTARSWPEVRQPRMHGTPYLRTHSRSGHGVRSTVGQIPHAVVHPPMAKRLRRVEIVTHTMDEKRKPTFVRRRWE